MKGISEEMEADQDEDDTQRAKYLVLGLASSCRWTRAAADLKFFLAPVGALLAPPASGPGLRPRPAADLALLPASPAGL